MTLATINGMAEAVFIAAGFLLVLAGGLLTALLRRRSVLGRVAALELVERLSDAVFVCDGDGRVVSSNAAASELTGRPSERLKGRTLESFVAAPRELRTLLDAGEAIRNAEIVFRTEKGERVQAALTVTRVSSARRTHLFVMARDVSARHRAEQEVLEALSAIAPSVTASGDGTLVVGHGCILAYNRQFAVLWGIPPSVMESGEDELIDRAIGEQVAETDAAGQMSEFLDSHADAESFDIVELKDGRRFERSSIGRPLGSSSIRVWTFRDVTPRYAAEAALRESEIRYRLLFEQNAAGVFVTRVDGRIVDCNTRIGTMLGYRRADLVGTNIRALYVRPLEHDELMGMLRDAPMLNSVEVELRHSAGQSVWVLQNLLVVGQGDSAVVHSTLVDISDRKRAEEQIEFHAYHDVLTHLPNRRLFTDRLRQSVTRARRTGKPLAVLFIDIDRFKEVNDTLGHTAGDELLLEMSRRLRACVREDDTVARLGGDEFTIILSDLRMPDDAVTVGQKILEAVQMPLEVGGTEVEVSASIGIALHPADGDDPESLLRNADTAMYRAKESGRNNLYVSTAEMRQRAVDRLSVETRLREAVASNSLFLQYQPQVSLVTGKILGAEALLRWNDPERGVQLPGDFLPMAEESRMVLPLGEWVIRSACRQLRSWLDAGLDPVRLSVNLSPRQLQQQDLPDQVQSAINESRIDPAQLTLEIAEEAATDAGDAALDILGPLREIGVSLAIDNFGTGYSSLMSLRRLPVAAVKIDRSLIAHVNSSSSDAALVDGLILIAHGFRIVVVGVGVENEEQLAFLQRRRCDAVQGFLVSHPVGADELAQLLADKKSLFSSQAKL